MEDKHQEALNIVKSRLKSMIDDDGDFTFILYDEVAPIFHEDIANELTALGYAVHTLDHAITIGSTDIQYHKGDMLISREQQAIDQLKNCRME